MKKAIVQTEALNSLVKKKEGKGNAHLVMPTQDF